MNITALSKLGPSKKLDQPHSVLQGREEDQQFLSSIATMKDPALDATFITAKSNLMDVSGYTLDESAIDKPVEMLTKNIPGTVSTKAISDPGKQFPHEDKKTMAESNDKKKGQQLLKQPEPASQQPPKQEARKAAPATAPAVMIGKEKKLEIAKPKTPAPASSGKPKKAPGSGAFGGMKSWLIKKLNPDAKECYLPDNEEQPYYDEKLKRWVFPGDDLDELSKPMAPPPIISKKEDEATKPKEPEKPKDAVSSMMAPPPARMPGAKKTPLRGMLGGMGSPMMMGMGGMMMPPGSGPTGMMSPGLPASSVTPKFATFTPKAAVFTPKPATETPKEPGGETTNNEMGEQ